MRWRKWQGNVVVLAFTEYSMSREENGTSFSGHHISGRIEHSFAAYWTYTSLVRTPCLSLFLDHLPCKRRIVHTMAILGSVLGNTGLAVLALTLVRLQILVSPGSCTYSEIAGTYLEPILWASRSGEELVLTNFPRPVLDTLWSGLERIRSRKFGCFLRKVEQLDFERWYENTYSLAFLTDHITRKGSKVM